ncbi:MULTISPECIES: hypothetical protein [unclassified Streptomyces]|uniref:deoxynucleotide monophosphate kinase family protein n=1 Tax=unclassified Streptomyces TaxID=2593676 RepID=UPI0033DE5D68
MGLHIGLIGRARSGKDTVGQWLTNHRGYRRVAFADPLKEMALRLNPIIEGSGDSWRLKETVTETGWESAKDAYPEVRRLLQELGAAVRTMDEDFWLRQALATVADVDERTGLPCVITDVRYPNEAESLKRAGFTLVYIDRPGIPHLDHESEGAIAPDVADHILINNGTVADLYRETHVIADRILCTESRRHEARIY